MNLTTNPYLQDILSQPEALRTALARFDETPLQALARTIHRGGFACIVLTGMGASFYAAYPVWLRMIQSGLPAYWIDTSELLHSAHALLSKHALLWVFSQSGRSAEIVALLERRDLHGVSVLATVNDLNSPLAQAAGERIIPLWAEAEYSVSTRTYLNTLALSQLAALALTGNPTQDGLNELYAVADSIEAYLARWQEHLQNLRERIPLTRKLVLLGRGFSLAAAYTGALILSEAAKIAAIGLQAGQFRHGPFELADPELTTLLFAGPPETQPLMARLHHDLLKAKARSFWIAPPGGDQPQSTHLLMPQARGLGMPLAEILPIQLLTLHLAAELGFEAGKFRHIGKITLNE